MIRHIAIFQVDEAKSTKAELEGIKTDLENLVDLIPELLAIEVGININPEEKQHLVLTADVENKADLDAYAQHPEHKKVGVRLRALVTGRTCVDYEI